MRTTPTPSKVQSLWQHDLWQHDPKPSEPVSGGQPAQPEPSSRQSSSVFTGLSNRHHPVQSKRVRVYRNGDAHFGGKEINIPTRTAGLGAFLDQVSEHLATPVDRLCTAGGRRVTKLAALTHAQSVVACTRASPFKPLRYGDIAGSASNPKPTAHPFAHIGSRRATERQPGARSSQPGARRRGQRLAPFATPGVHPAGLAPAKVTPPRMITVVRNGEGFAAGGGQDRVSVPLTTRNTLSWGRLLNVISSEIQSPNPVEMLCTTYGRKITSTFDLVDGDLYVAVPKRFKHAQYTAPPPKLKLATTPAVLPKIGAAVAAAASAATATAAATADASAAGPAAGTRTKGRRAAPPPGQATSAGHAAASSPAATTQGSRWDYTVTVWTGGHDSAGTDANIHLTLIGPGGESGRLLLDNGDPGRFKAGACDTFAVQTDASLGGLTAVRLEHQCVGASFSWQPTRVQVRDTKTEAVTRFDCHRWLVDDGGRELSFVELVAPKCEHPAKPSIAAADSGPGPAPQDQTAPGSSSGVSSQPAPSKQPPTPTVTATESPAAVGVAEAEGEDGAAGASGGRDGLVAVLVANGRRAVRRLWKTVDPDATGSASGTAIAMALAAQQPGGGASSPEVLNRYRGWVVGTELDPDSAAWITKKDFGKFIAVLAHGLELEATIEVIETLGTDARVPIAAFAHAVAELWPEVQNAELVAMLQTLDPTETGVPVPFPAAVTAYAKSRQRSIFAKKSSSKKKKKAEARLREAAATTIQASYRGHVARTRLRAVRAAMAPGGSAAAPQPTMVGAEPPPVVAMVADTGNPRLQIAAAATPATEQPPPRETVTVGTAPSGGGEDATDHATSDPNPSRCGSPVSKLSEGRREKSVELVEQDQDRVVSRLVHSPPRPGTLVPARRAGRHAAVVIKVTEEPEGPVLPPSMVAVC